MQPDEEAEYDSMDTVLAISDALQRDDREIILLEEDGMLPEKLKDHPIDLAFNIAEGHGKRGREAQVPALLDYYGIPYTGSDTTALAVSLDKEMTKRLAHSYGVRTPKSVLIHSQQEYHADALSLTFPVIVKPNAEGSGKGITDVSVAKNITELNALLKKNFMLYEADMLVEEYIAGREFTVGILGNGLDTKVFNPMELRYKTHTQEQYDVYSYNVKKNYQQYIEYQCPAQLDEQVEAEMMQATLSVYHALGCQDLSRADFRMDEEGKVYFIEINPLPGLAKGYSDYPMLAEFCGMDFHSLLNTILDVAMARIGK